MALGLIGKTLKDENNDEYIVLNELNFKNIPCVYTAKITSNEEEGKKQFFQLSKEGELSLVTINSKKMISSLNESLIKYTQEHDNPRKIEENESIPDYLAYLDDYYKSKIVTHI